MLSKDLDEVHAMAEAVLAHKTARGLFESAPDREVSVFADLDGVPVRCRFDALGPDENLAIDLKTSMDASAGGFEKSAAQWGYHIQEAHYRATYEASEGVDPRFVFVVVEKTPPHLVAIHKLSLMWGEMGATAAREARRLFAECTARNEWPGYPEEVQVLEPPAWSVVEHEMRFEQEAY